MSYQYVKDYRKKLKAWAVECSGGSCRICGYKSHYSALEFHHLDPEAKEFSLSRNANTSHSRFKSEALKCILLCANCHREVEAGFRTISGMETIWNDLPFPTRQPLGRTPKPSKTGMRKTPEGFFKVNWNEVDLPELLKTMPVVRIASLLGVSDNAVRKRAKKLGLM